MKSKVFIVTLIFTILAYNLAFGSGGNIPSSVASDTIPWWSVNAGGTICSLTTPPFYKLYSSVGQSVAGKCSTDIGLVRFAYSGFWNPWVDSMMSDVEEEKEVALPKEFSLSQNYPNPFNPHTVIEYALPKESHVKIVVYNILGQKVRVLKDEIEREGYKRVVWDGRDDTGSEVASGIYFYRIVAGDFVKAKKMMMVK